MTVGQLVLLKRKHLGEDQKTFGKRFGVTGTAVSLWESDKRDAPNRVVEFCILTTQKKVICTICDGKGYMMVVDELSKLADNVQLV